MQGLRSLHIHCKTGHREGDVSVGRAVCFLSKGKVSKVIRLLGVCRVVLGENLVQQRLQVSLESRDWLSRSIGRNPGQYHLIFAILASVQLAVGWLVTHVGNRNSNTRGYLQFHVLNRLGGHSAVVGSRSALADGPSGGTKGSKPHHDFVAGLFSVCGRLGVLIHKHIDGHVGIDPLWINITHGYLALRIVLLRKVPLDIKL